MSNGRWRSQWQFYVNLFNPNGFTSVRVNCFASYYKGVTEVT